MRLPVRTVHVTTAAELDAELATADQVIVEGDEGYFPTASTRHRMIRGPAVGSR
jgi:hypothetical protein